MALTGVHILCTSVRLLKGSSLICADVWSETLSGSGLTTNVAPSSEMILQISAGIDAFIAIGPNPDATQIVGTTNNTARIFIPAGVTMPVFCAQGDKVAYQPA